MYHCMERKNMQKMVKKDYLNVYAYTFDEK